MKLQLAVICASAAHAAVLSATSCSFGDYETYLPNFAQGFQFDADATDTGCYEAVSNFVIEWNFLAWSFRNYSHRDWLGPIYHFQDSMVQAVVVFSECQTTNAARQLSVRTEKLSGVSEMTGAFLGAMLRSNQGGTSSLWQGWSDFRGGTDCPTRSKGLGKFLSGLLNYQVPDKVFFKEVGWSLLDQINGQQ